MKFSRAIFPALAALCFISTAGIAADSPPPPPPHGDHGGPGGPGDMMKFLSPEEHMMLFERMHRNTAAMTEQQRHEYMGIQMAAFKTMSEADKQKLAASLRAEWDALPTARQAQLKKEMEERRARHPGEPGHP